MSVDGQRLILRVVATAEGQWDYVYDRTCNYVTWDEAAKEAVPDCIVGHGMWFENMCDASWLDDDSRYGTYNSDAINEVAPVVGDFDADEIEWLQAVQDAQDGTLRHTDGVAFRNDPAKRVSWGKAIELADAAVPSIGAARKTWLA